MVETLTSDVKKKIKKNKRDGEVMRAYEGYCAQHKISDAITLTCNEFGIAIPTFYAIKKRYTESDKK